ncbi:ExbD/TolR family protein [Derxia lacustris]|uniref:ExbD/TolR family protein n=1 Tax=Derxia lacustris TaxID=764842 RepID=UPI000A1757B0|nr:biopolymer transporter ExbD [Derxia lacustris]
MAFDGFSPRREPRAPIADINTTPLVDVMLVLLVVFIVAAPLLGAAIRLDLPSAGGTQAVAAGTRVTVAIEADGAAHWDADPLPIDDEELARRLKSAAAARPSPQLLINADRAVRYERVAIVLGMARAAGLEQVGFVALPDGVR